MSEGSHNKFVKISYLPVVFLFMCLYLCYIRVTLCCRVEYSVHFSILYSIYVACFTFRPWLLPADVAVFVRSLNYYSALYIFNFSKKTSNVKKMFCGCIFLSYSVAD